MAFTYSACSSCAQVNRFSVEKAEEATPTCGKCGAQLHYHGGISELTGAALKALVRKSPVPVIADFWAAWCGPCRMFAPTFEQASKRLAGQAVFVKVNTEEDPSISHDYMIRGVPTLLAFEGGREKTRASGALPLPQFLQWISQSVRLYSDADGQKAG
jgi:thioredoxin 2